MHAVIKEIEARIRQAQYDRDLRSKNRLTVKEVEKIKKSAQSHLGTYAGPNVKFRVSALQIRILCDMAIDRMPEQAKLF